MRGTTRNKLAYGAIAAVVALTALTAGAQNCLIISEIVDGPLPGGLPKFVELTNTGTTSVNLADYSLGTINNGAASSNTDPFTLFGILHPGESYVISLEFDDYPGSGAFLDVYGVDPSNHDLGAFTNGNDVIVLYAGNPGTPHNGTGAADIYGVVGVDGIGTVWEYTDSYARRNASATAGSPVFAPGEWTFGGPGALTSENDLLNLTNPFAHTFNPGCGPQDPIGSCCVDTFYCYETTQAECAALGGTNWTQGQSCDSQPCGTPPPVGACCIGGACVNRLTEAECTGQGGQWQGAGSYCTPDPCLGCTTIPQARELPLFSEVLLCDVVVNNSVDTIFSATSISFQVQEQETALGQRGGITLYGSNTELSPIYDYVFEGDVIRIQGVTDEFSGLLELTAPFVFDPNVDIIEYGFERPDPVPVTGAILSGADPNLAETYESMFVEIPCAKWVDIGEPPVWDDLTNYTFTADGYAFTVRIPNSGLDLLGTDIPTDRPLRLRGILSQFNEYQLLLTRGANVDDPGSDVYADPDCLLRGACCLADNSCIETDETDCTAQGGTYQGGGTVCFPDPCGEPRGACCLTGGACTLATEAECAAQGGAFLGETATCGPVACPEPVQAGDLAFGLSDGNRFLTAEQVRPSAGDPSTGTLVGTWALYSYIQSFEFDNAGGTLHNAQGNLLALNYGTSAGGGLLFNYATDGSGRAEQIYAFSGQDQGHGEGPDYLSRVTGLGVSPDNRYLSVWGSDKKYLYILEYDAGPAVGTGTGAAITDAWVGTLTAPGNAGASQGTTWLDEDTVLVTWNAGGGIIRLASYDFDPNAATAITAGPYLDLFFPAAGQFEDVEYNPDVSPYVFVLASQFTSGASQSYLAAVDPRTTPWQLVKMINLSESSDTARECALGPDGYLYWCQYSSDIDRLDVSDPASWTDHSSADYYTSDTFVSYSGLDIAHGAAPPPGCPGDYDCDDDIDFFDIDLLLAALGGEQAWATKYEQKFGTAPPCGYLANCDADQNGSVDFFDIDAFLDLLGTDCP